jgi:uncharacterized protein (TIGR02996 family)
MISSGQVNFGQIGRWIGSYRSMSQQDFVSNLERMDEYERGFVKSLWDNPRDVAARKAYSDWLEDHNRAETAKQIREGYTFGYGYYYET